VKKYLPFLTLIFLVSLIAFSIYKLNSRQQGEIGGSNNEPDINFAKVSIALPDFSLPDLFDKDAQFEKENLLGHYSLVNLFASWCTTCHAEHEILLQLKAENIIDIYGIAWRDIESKTKKYLATAGNPFKRVAKDSGGLFTKMTGLNAIPETWIVDPQGTVVMRFRGNLQSFNIDEIKKFLAAAKRKE
jgi:cytochrome c biogenesis protein CcmG/thiol:disulfide interchange protein DsbE